MACCVYLSIVGGVQAQSADMEAVVVTATRTPVKKTEVIGDVVVIERDQIEQSQGLTLGEVLRQQAGVQMTSNGGLGKGSSVFIRGTESRHVLLLIDGVRYGSATLGTPNWDNLPLAAIERIEVLRGPAASLYGSDAVGGVVQIFTRKGAAGVPQSYASLTLGSEGRRELSVGVSGGSQQLSYSLGVGALRETGFSATNSKVTSGNFNADRDGFSQESLHGMVQWQVAPRLEADFQMLVSSGNSQFDSSLNGSANFDVHGLTTTRTAGIGLAKSWVDGGKTRLKVSRADDLTRNLYRTSTTVFDTSRDQWSIQHDEPSRLGTVTLGAEHTQEAVSGTTSFSEPTRKIDGLFAGLQGRGGNHRWQANIRHDDNTRFGSATTGMVGYGYQVNAMVALHVSKGTAFKAPTFNQIQFNPTIKPEQSSNSELGLKLVSGAVNLDWTWFRTELQDLVNWVNVGGAWIPGNVDRAEIQGHTLALRTAMQGWSFSANLEVIDARNRTPGTGNGRKLQRRADEQLTLSVERSVSSWLFGAQVLLVADRFEDVANTRRLPGFGTLSLSAERPLGDDWTLQMRLNNVGDKVYETAYGYNQPGRAFYTTVNWRPKR